MHQYNGTELQFVNHQATFFNRVQGRGETVKLFHLIKVRIIYSTPVLAVKYLNCMNFANVQNS